MKQLFIGLLLLSAVAGKAQPEKSFDEASVIPSYPLDITLHKTTLLIFPAAIQSADRGDSYILAEKVKGVDNVLKVKAAQKGFAPASLGVITEDGKVYSFTVSYSDNPAYQVVDLKKQQRKESVQFTGLSLNPEQIAAAAGIAAAGRPFLHGVKQHRHEMKYKLQGIYIRKDLLLFCFAVKNHSELSYTPDFMRFYIRDKKQPRRTAVREEEVKPLWLRLPERIDGGTSRVMVAVFRQFTTSDDKYFTAELMEKNGDRNLQLKVSERQLLKARKLPVVTDQTTEDDGKSK